MRPRNIPLDDYSYAIEFTKYELDKLQKKYDLPSTAVSLIVGDETIFQEVTGISNIEDDIQADINTVFKAGSISKLFTAIEIMRLYEDGLVDLDVPITTYLPDFKINNRFNDSDPITIRNILSHRSGLPRNDNLPQWAWDNGTNVFRDMVASLAESHIAFPANQRFKYSNIGFNILGRIIEVVTGEWFAFRMRDSLFLPVGMTSSGFVSSLIQNPSRIAVGYFTEGKNKVPYNQHDIINMASGGIYTTIEDLSDFAKFILNKGKVNDVQLINETTLSMMFQSKFSKPTDPQKVGMGFFVDRSYLPNNELTVFHAGTNQGTKSIIALVPEQQLGVILISNSEEFEDPSKSLVMEILEIMQETKTGIKKIKESNEVKDVAPNILQNYTGKYAVEGDIAEVFLSGDNLKLNYLGYTVSLTPINDTTFAATHSLVSVGNIKVRFFEDFLILSLEGLHNAICPVYDVSEELIANWTSYLGDYEVWQRYFSLHTGEETAASVQLIFEEGVLRFSWHNFILQPLSQTELIILGGAFEGELMCRVPESGFIYWQNRVFKPSS
ncbi:MAG: serine hydrolase domain-containing protein [Candidatus Heimdallarchaeaceae archaeon]